MKWHGFRTNQFQAHEEVHFGRWNKYAFLSSPQLIPRRCDARCPRPIRLSPCHCKQSKGAKRKGVSQEEEGGSAALSSSYTTKRGGGGEKESERLGRTERGKGDDQEWEEERTLRLNGGPTEERASGRCLEQSWLMRALQLAAPHNGIKEGGRAAMGAPLPLSLSLSDHPAIVGGQRLNGRVGS